MKSIPHMTDEELAAAIENREDWLEQNAGIERMFDRKTVRKYDRYVTEIESLQEEVKTRKEKE